MVIPHSNNGGCERMFNLILKGYDLVDRKSGRVIGYRLNIIIGKCLILKWIADICNALNHRCERSASETHIL